MITLHKMVRTSSALKPDSSRLDNIKWVYQWILYSFRQLFIFPEEQTQILKEKKQDK